MEFIEVLIFHTIKQFLTHYKNGIFTIIQAWLLTTGRQDVCTGATWNVTPSSQLTGTEVTPEWSYTKVSNRGFKGFW